MLINCVVYQDGKKLADIPISDISDYVTRPDCFVWVALRDATPQELATNLSYLVAGGPPDSALQTAMTTLGTPDGRETQVRRLLGVQAGRDRMVRVVREWLGVDRIMETAKDTTVYARFTFVVRATAATETKKFIDEVVQRSTGTVGELLSANWSIVDSTLAPIYGVTSAGATLKTPLPGGGKPNPYCASFKPQDPDRGENAQSVGSVLTFGAFTAASISDGRTGPPPCPAATHDQCAESGPGYLAGGALSYVIQRLSGSGTVRASLVAWRPGYPATTLLSFPGGPPPQSYAITAQGQAIWASAPARPKGPWTVWRWSGGTPVKITTLPALGASPYYGVAAIAW